MTWQEAQSIVRRRYPRAKIRPHPGNRPKSQRNRWCVAETEEPDSRQLTIWCVWPAVAWFMAARAITLQAKDPLAGRGGV